MLGLAAAGALLACETPPSKYIPPPEPREVPNLDPPPGIPVMPSASGAPAGSYKIPASASVTLPSPTSCKTHGDCALTTTIACCTAGDPRAVTRAEADKLEADCADERTRCVDIEMKGDPTKMSDYVARCVNKVCTRVEKKKKKAK